MIKIRGEILTTYAVIVMVESAIYKEINCTGEAGQIAKEQKVVQQGYRLEW